MSEFMWFSKKCDICGEKTDGNCVKDYHDVASMIGLPPENNAKYICFNCLARRVTVKCCKCEKILTPPDQYEIKEYFERCSRFYDNFVKFSNAIRIYDIQAPEVQWNQGCNRDYVCPECYGKMINQMVKSIENTICPLSKRKEVGPVIENWDLVETTGGCCRCGGKVCDSRMSELIKLLYTPQSAFQFDWNDAGGDNVINLDYKIYLDSVRLLLGKNICRDCAKFLLPENIKNYLSVMEWKGMSDSDMISGYHVLHLFDRIEVDYDITFFGANGFVDEAFWGDKNYHSFHTDQDLRNYFVEKAKRLGANCCLNAKVKAPWRGAATPAVVEPISVVKTKKTSSANNDTNSVEHLIIDGSNMILGTTPLSVEALLACVKTLQDKKMKWNVYLDANIYHALEEKGVKEDGEKLKDFIAANPHKVSLVPAGIRADDFILLRADKQGSHIITNDRYLQYVDRYPWIGDERLHKFMISDGMLMIPDLGICETLS